MISRKVEIRTNYKNSKEPKTLLPLTLRHTMVLTFISSPPSSHVPRSYTSFIEEKGASEKHKRICYSPGRKRSPPSLLLPFPSLAICIPLLFERYFFSFFSSFLFFTFMKWIFLLRFLSHFFQCRNRCLCIFPVWEKFWGFFFCFFCCFFFFFLFVLFFWGVFFWGGGGGYFFVGFFFFFWWGVCFWFSEVFSFFPFGEIACLSLGVCLFFSCILFFFPFVMVRRSAYEWLSCRCHISPSDLFYLCILFFFFFFYFFFFLSAIYGGPLYETQTTIFRFFSLVFFSALSFG